MPLTSLYVPNFASLHNPALFWALALVSAFFIGFSKSGVSGAGVIVIPLMALIFPPKESTGILLPMLVAGDIIGVFLYRSHARWKKILMALPWAFLGIMLGWLFMKFSGISQDSFKKVIGIMVLLMLALGEWLRIGAKEGKEGFPHSWQFAAMVGVTGGAATMMANAAGPIFAIYLLSLGLPKENFIGTNAWIFLILNSIKIPFSYDLGFITGPSLLFNAFMIPALLCGAFAGVAVVRRIGNKAFAFLIKFFAAISALRLVF